MNSLRKYTYWYIDWKKTVEFFSDRVESSSDFWGLGVERTKKTISRAELAPHLTEAMGASQGRKGALRWASGSLLLFLILHTVLPSPWRNFSYILLVLFFFHSYYLIVLSKKLDWIFMYKKTGTMAAGVKINGWTPEERKEFHRFYGQWINMPSHTLAHDTHTTATV